MMAKTTAMTVRSTTLLLLATLATALMPGPMRAQTWSPQEQEAIDHLAACWSTWAARDFDVWAQTCRLDPAGSYWEASEVAPSSMDLNSPYLGATARRDFEDLDVVAWDIRPIRVTSWGNVVGVYFFGVMRLRDPEGNVTVIQDKRFEVLRKVDGRWGVVGGMSVVDTR